MATKTAKKTTTRKTAVKKPFNQVRDEVETQEVVDEKFNAFVKGRKDEVIAAVSGISVDKTVQLLTQVNLDVGRTLSEVQQKVIEKVSELNEIDEAIKIKNEELQALYDKESILEETRALINDHDSRLKEYQEQREQIEAELKEYESDRKKALQREEQEYNYTTKLNRQRAEEAFNDKSRLQIKELNEKQETFEKGWKVREEAIAAREAEFNQFKSRVESFPAELEAAVKKAEAITASSVKRDLTHAFELEKQGLQTQNKILEQQVNQQQAIIGSQNSEIQRLRDQLEAANQKIVEVANGAFASVSGQSALSAIQGFASGNTQQGKPAKA